MALKDQEKIFVLADIVSFEKKFPKAPKKSERREALEKYFSTGGVIKAFPSDTEWPKISYPSYMVLNTKLDEVKKKHNSYKEKLGGWKKSYNSASHYHQFNQIKKFKEPLYWKHLAKIVSNSDYRKDSDSVKLPAHLVADNKWKPMVKMFVNDLEYRKQLAETVNTSIVYKKDKKVAKYADDLQDFRMGASGKQIEGLDKKLAELEELEKALHEMQKWSKE